MTTGDTSSKYFILSRRVTSHFSLHHMLQDVLILCHGFIFDDFVQSMECAPVFIHILLLYWSSNQSWLSKIKWMAVMNFLL
jgi:hypothetical protein